MRWVALLLAFGCGSSHTAPPRVDPIARIEQRIPPRVRVQGDETFATLADRMREAKVPAISVAVFEHYQLQWAHAWGFADVERRIPATATTLFQAGSISKSGNALAVLEAVADGQLSLDAPINTQLAGWKLPDNELTAGHPVTLRQLLGHTAGTTVHGFPGYAPGAPLPTLAQVLDGAPPSNTPAVRVDLAPGSTWRYSGGGITITQLALEEHAHQPYAAILAARVLGPLGMTRSTYEQPLPAAREAEAATGYRADGAAVEGRHHVYPEMAAAGLWTTPSDLARFFAEVALARTGGSKRIAKAIALQMTTKSADLPDATGLGTFVFEKGGVTMFGHTGADDGFQAYALASMDGYGVVVMANSDNGQALFEELFAAVALEQGWPASEPAIARIPLDATQRAAFTGWYATPRSDLITATVADRGGALELRFPFGKPHALIPVSADTLVDRDSGNRLQLRADGALEIRANGQVVGAFRRLGPDAPLLFALESGPLDAAVSALRARNPTKDDHDRLIDYAYGLLRGQPADAVKVFQLAAGAFPTSANAQDSLGEALIAAHDPARAITAYTTALALLDADPFIPASARAAFRTHATDQLATLRAK